MAGMARPPHRPSFTRSSLASGSVGTPTREETQYIIAGTGKLYLEDGSTHAVGPGSVFVLPTPLRHDLENTGTETLRAVAFFAAAMFTQDFDQVMLPPKSHILGTPNRAG
jgi:Cupin domain